MRHNDLEAVDRPTHCLAENLGPSMADDRDAEIEAVKLKIANLLVAAHYRGCPKKRPSCISRSFGSYGSGCMT